MARFFVFFTLCHLSLTFFRPEAPFNSFFAKIHNIPKFDNIIITQWAPFHHKELAYGNLRSLHMGMQCDTDSTS